MSSVGGGGGGGGGGNGGGALVGMGAAVLGVGCALVDARGATDVDSPGPVAGLLRNTNMTTGTATTAAAAAISAIVACLVRYQGNDGGRNVNELIFGERS
ncbi:MAG TPA: hypothetical protein VN888_03260 [Mycobacterium sp.]|nr:hypothetical protein [Mycobacterium sp.]